MSAVMKKSDLGAVVAGLVLIVVGVLFLLNNLDITSFGYVVRRYWPMIVVIVAIPQLFRVETVWAGLWLLTIGFWLQVCHLRIWGLTYGSSWPLLLIVLGGGIAVRAVVEAFMPRVEERNGEH